jgi:acyl phosphate:glycerol-3-phosphate acyltransferase
MEAALVILAAYAIGSISFAIVVSRLMALPDPRSYGSRNPGATNVLRSGSKAAAILTLAGDAAKGWFAVWLAGLVSGHVHAAALAGLAAFLGHLFPVYHRFHGGKGVATASGVLFGFDLWLGLGALAAWVVVAACFRYASLASIVSAVAALCLAWFIDLDLYVVAVTAVMGALLIWRHRENIVRLLAGNESRLGAKSTG